jgi:hypothetical protein
MRAALLRELKGEGPRLTDAASPHGGDAEGDKAPADNVTPLRREP